MMRRESTAFFCEKQDLVNPHEQTILRYPNGLNHDIFIIDSYPI